MKLTYLHVNASGLELFLGPLEAAIMRAAWDKCHTTRRIYNHVREHYESKNTDDIAFTSITSTVFRLYDRGFLKRTGDKRRHTYIPVADTEALFVETALRLTLDRILASYPREAGRIIVEYLRNLRSAANV